MRIYARVVDGVVQEIIPPLANDEGVEVPIEERFPADTVLTLIDVTGENPMPDCWWTFAGGSFAPPVIPEKTPAEILSINTGIRNNLLAFASLAIGPLQDAADLDVATAQEEELLKKWKQYRVAVNRVEMAVLWPEWPPEP